MQKDINAPVSYHDDYVTDRGGHEGTDRFRKYDAGAREVSRRLFAETCYDNTTIQDIIDQLNLERTEISRQSVPTLKNPRILAGMIDTDRRLQAAFSHFVVYSLSGVCMVVLRKNTVNVTKILKYFKENNQKG